LVINGILGPIQETGLTPTKDLRSFNPPLFLIGDTVAWNVVLVWITLFKCLSDISEGDINYLGHSMLCRKLRPRRPFNCSQCNTIIEKQWSVQCSHTSCSITYCIIVVFGGIFSCLHDPQAIMYLSPQMVTVGEEELPSTITGFQVNKFNCASGLPLFQGRFIFFFLMCRHNRGFYLFMYTLKHLWHNQIQTILQTLS